MLLTKNTKRKRYEALSEQYEDFRPRQAGFAFDKKLLVRYTTRARIAIRLLSYCQDPDLLAELQEKAPDEPDPDRPFLDFDGKTFRYWAPFKDNNLAKDAGFRFSDSPEPHWWSQDFDAAVRCHNNCANFPGYYQQSDTAKEALETWTVKRDAALAASRAASGFVEIPRLKKVPYPFQYAAILFAKINHNCFIADDMGLGKTIQALALIQAEQLLPAVVVCPAHLKYNWRNEARDWLPIADQDIAILNGTKAYTLGRASLYIINYDILTPWVSKLDALRPKIVIFDESQYLKTGKTEKQPDGSRRFTTKRVQAAANLAVSAPRKLMLTGTPIMNRPQELLPQLEILGRINEFGGAFKFLLRYCNGHKQDGFWDFTGTSHLDELQNKLRGNGIMIRRLKSDVLTELPPKRRQIIEIEPENRDQLVAEQNAWAHQEQLRERLELAVELAKASDNPEDYKRAVAALREGMRGCFEEMARLRKETAIAKVPYVIQHVKALLEEQDKLVIFVHHHAVVDLLKLQFEESCVVLTGRESKEQKQKAVERFQSDPSVRVFIGSITAAGTGITLTSASTVVFGELSWVPAELSQCEDRLHRIGQRDSVLVQHLVLAGSLDAQMAVTLVCKQQIIDKALDNDTNIPQLAEVIEEPDRMTVPVQEGLVFEGPSTRSVSRERIAAEANLITDGEIRLVHSQLKRLAAACDGAFARDHAGFNKFDSPLGKKLAGLNYLTPKQAVLGRSLCAKYHAQLEAV